MATKLSIARVALLAALMTALGLGGVTAPPSAADEADLAPRYLAWLDEVRPLMTKAERAAFLELEEDYQRDAFIERFWAARDWRPATRENEFRDRYYALLEEALERYDGLDDERALVYVLHGEPADVLATDCGVLTWPMELWTYGYSEVLGRGFQVLLYQRNGGGPFRIWYPSEGYHVLAPRLPPGANVSVWEAHMRERCSEFWEDTLAFLADVRGLVREGDAGVSVAAQAPEQDDPEWLATFHSFSTDVPEGAPELPAELDFEYPSPHRLRTVVAGTVRVPTEAATAVVIGERESLNFELTGEVLADDKLFESFRYRYDLPLDRVDSSDVALVFERYLRPGDYRVVVQVKDLGGSAVYREDREITVPRLEAAADPVPLDAAIVADVEEATRARPGEVTLALHAGAEDLARGLARFEAVVEGGEPAKVRFLVDDRPVFTKTQPPFSVELNLGRLPRRRTLRAVALAADDSELAADELVVNGGENTFRVRIVEPRGAGTVTGRKRVRLEVDVPSGSAVESVELFLNDVPVAQLFQQPWSQPVDFGPAGEIAFLRAVASLEDGNVAEDVTLVNGGEFGAAVEVRLVELFATVLDGSGRPVHDLSPDELAVRDQGRPQELVRFERLEDLPLHAALLIDTSASMAEHLPRVQQIAQAFFERTLRSKDRAAVVTFAETPRLATELTNDAERLSGALAGLTAAQGTALWDSVVFSLYQLHDLSGQRALIVLSDGDDRRSSFTFEEVVEYAQTTGVTIYPIALAKGLKRGARGRLESMAEATGGRAFLLDGIDELDAVYQRIQEDLRSRYLLVYQAPTEPRQGFRSVAVDVSRPGHRVRTLAGYYP